jgi:hypothetical protein
MSTPYAQIEGRSLHMNFSSADFSVASVIAAIRLHLDMLEEMGVMFLGCTTEVPSGPSPVFRPVDIKAIFEFCGSGEAQPALERAYQIVWRGIVDTFPSEREWAEAKGDFAKFICAQADLLRARVESLQQ